MRLYSGPAEDFVVATERNQIASILEREMIQQIGHRPSPQEKMSWENSLLRMSVILRNAKLFDHGVMLEYQIPSYGGRIDFLITGKDKTEVDNTVIVELKQWTRTELSEFDSDKVVTWTGGGKHSVLHPAVQVSAYRQFLKFHHTSFYDEKAPISLHACSYLHNYDKDPADCIFDTRFQKYIDECKLFTRDDSDQLTTYLVEKLEYGQGLPILNRIEKGEERPSRQLLTHVGESVKTALKQSTYLLGDPNWDYILMDEQIIAYDSILSIVKKGLHDRKKFSIIIKGGPGTGKSVIALKLLSDLHLMGKNAQYATGSRSFTQTLRKIVGSQPGGYFFKYFMSYGQVARNAIDVLIMDEAHRIREKTGYPHKATGNLQIEDLINACKVAVFLVDELQVVRPNEIGSIDFIRQQAARLGCEALEFELTGQFRCAGSDAFINWVDHILQIRTTANPEWVEDPNFDFRIFDSPQSLEDAIKEKLFAGKSARLTAGFCWPWSDKTDSEGSLFKDVKIGRFERPWNARDDLKGLAGNIPPAALWAFHPNGVGQVGCIYTAQGFEFDYVGVIFGPDLRYDFETNSWRGFPKDSCDAMINKADNFTDLVKRTYRVLLTRGRKGCFVHFMDKDTERYFRSRIRAKT